MVDDAAARYESGAYLAANPDWHMEDSPWKAANIARLLEETAPAFATAVEVGCGAGLILQEFVADGIPWAHIDIAGPAWSDADDADLTKGGTGFGVRLLVDLVANFATP